MRQFTPAALVLLVSISTALASSPNKPQVNLALPITGKIAVGIKDVRPEVVNGEWKESFFGFMRLYTGGPITSEVPLESKGKFAEQLSNFIVAGLRNSGNDVTRIPLSPFDPREKSIEELRASSADRLLLFELTKWSLYRGSFQTTLHYDVKLLVFDAQGEQLGSSAVNGDDKLGKRQRPERKDMDTATADIFQALLSSGTVLSAFGRSEKVPPVPTGNAQMSRCSR